MTHKLIDGTLGRDVNGIFARCECGWSSGGHFSSAGASAAFADHVEKTEDRQRRLAREDMGQFWSLDFSPRKAVWP